MVGQGGLQQIGGGTKEVSTDQWRDKEGFDRSEVGMGLNRSVVEQGRHMIYIYREREISQNSNRLQSRSPEFVLVFFSLFATCAGDNV